MLRYRRTIQVPLPADEVFAFVTDFRNAARWDPRVTAADKQTAGPIGVGTRFVLVSRTLGPELELPYAVERFEPPTFAALAGETRALRYRDELRIEEVDAGHARLTYAARLSLRGVLVIVQLLLYPAFRWVFQRIGDDAVEGIRAALLAHSRRLGDTELALTEVSVEWVRAIVAREDQPVLRNLLITQGYWQISRRLAALVRDHANWCTYATWASKTAGVFVRQETLDLELRRLLQRNARLRRRLRSVQAAFARIDPRAGLLGEGDDELGLILRMSEEVGRFITAGNLRVFAELGEVFAAFIEAFEDDAHAGTPDAARLEQFVTRFRPGPSRADRLTRGADGEIHASVDGGQDLLRDAMLAYHAALFEPDARARAQLILYGNALGGLHEQTRLQSYIVGALHAPLNELFIDRLLDELRRRAAGELPPTLVDAVRGLLIELGDEAFEALRQATSSMMTMRIPGEVLALGRDLPAPAVGPLYPALLDPIEHPELATILAEHGAYDSPGARVKRPLWLRLRRQLMRLRSGRTVAVGSAARDWGDLGERMRFIFCYFRSRQCEPRLFESPFSPEQTREILLGRIPDGSL